jgi:predicted nucleic acid-binding protein
MKVLVDTSTWSLAFRRKEIPGTNEEQNRLKELKELISETRAIMIGPIRQEILSGISNLSQFEQLKEKLKAFENYPIILTDYELAAGYYNKCRKNGIQGSHIDFLICAVAKRNKMAIFTSDNDFQNYSGVLELNLHAPRELDDPGETMPDNDFSVVQ